MMNAAEERLSVYAASLENPCETCRSEAREQATTMCARCLYAATYNVATGDAAVPRFIVVASAVVASAIAVTSVNERHAA